MGNFINGIVRADGEQWFGFIALAFLSSLLITAVFAINADHNVECSYLQAYQEGGFTQYRIMNQINWMIDGKAFSSIDADKALSAFSAMENKCPVK